MLNLSLLLRDYMTGIIRGKWWEQKQGREKGREKGELLSLQNYIMEK